MALDANTIRQTLGLLERVQLVGGEVPAFVQLTNALNTELLVLQAQANKPPQPEPTTTE